MQLISLRANKESFRPVVFKNGHGLNFIVARQAKGNENQSTNTYNGVGKSLLIAIIHFCLGSNANDSFEENLQGWEFTLSFKIGEEEFTSMRATLNQKIILLNGEEYKIKSFNETLEALLFDIPEGVAHLSFRNLLSFFIRPRRISYEDFKDPNGQNKPYDSLLQNSFLIGLNVRLVQEKFRLRLEKERIRKLVVELKKDHLLKDFFTGNRNVALAAQDLEEQIAALELDLKNFNVADDYYEIKRQADLYKRKLEDIQNNIVLLENQISNIETSLQLSPDIKKDSILRIYKEASVVLAGETIKRLEELELFYAHLTKNRQKRLLDQKEALASELLALRKDHEVTSRQFDGALKYLDTHQALDVFVKLANKVADMKSEKERLLRYDELLNKYKQSKVTLEKDFQTATEETFKYLKEVQVILKDTRDFFRELAKRFYPKSSAGITLYNNDGDNQIRFDFDVRIEADASDGINNVKIFCYDLTLLLKGYGHHMDTIFHDSRLLDAVDPRQLAELFRVLRDYILSSNKQYILTINENHLAEIRPYLDQEEFTSIIEDNICHLLEDRAPESKLLGIQIDMDYE
ncbi:uncharacterized protein YydD (DUF2326 family) [Filimonas zeae]|uniref:DUF2326 domain-containing protein n=1 Tax=Filimonas zeae TaxID=1737353 RepID=A0A917IP24_9BACT|nr:DUF2326 domain-containing protein [Filimonas zeae]MDR6337399.1 uncharacterized protein YydD (DUF2326 family) [Filimonas zeae]GGH58418.1 hypothetical protein GCM10011379_04130 [Filimonas zeae]